MNRFFFLLIIISGFLLFSFDSASASPSIAISPTSGNVGTTITTSGSGFTPSIPNATAQCMNNQNPALFCTGVSQQALQGNIWLHKLTGLPIGAQIKSAGVSVVATGSNLSTDWPDEEAGND